MDRITHATRDPNANGTGKAGFTNGQTSTQRAATVIDASFLNAIQEEMIAAIVAAGLTPNAADLTQFAQAIAIAATGSASANAISIRGTSVLASPAPSTGMVLQHNGTAYLPGLVTDSNVSASAALATSKLAGPGRNFLDHLVNTGSGPSWASNMVTQQPAIGGVLIDNYVVTGIDTANVVVLTVNGSPGAILGGLAHGTYSTNRLLFVVVASVTASALQLTFKHQSSSSSADNRFSCPGNADVTVSNKIVPLYYSPGSGWRVIA